MNNDYLSLKTDSFNLIKEAKRLFIYIDLYVYENFPKNKKHLKVLCFDEITNYIKNIILANNSSGNIRLKYQNNALLNISVIDFLITYFYDLKIINKRRYLSALRLLNINKKLLTGWINAKKQ